jgi:endonuclease-3 related protein
MNSTSQLQEIYDRLYQFYGPQNWWPAESRIEMLIGAVLTQNTNWQNVRKAIDALRIEGLLSFEALSSISVDALSLCIKSSGYYNLKAKRLKNLLQMIEDEYGGSLDDLLETEPHSARESLLSVKGIGPETADSILLYAGGHPLFVVDAYTHRIFSRHNLVPDDCDYQSLQDLFMDNLPHDSPLFNEYHALIIKTAKQFCKKNKPLCEKCPLFDG